MRCAIRSENIKCDWRGVIRTYVRTCRYDIRESVRHEGLHEKIRTHNKFKFF